MKTNQITACNRGKEYKENSVKGKEESGNAAQKNVSHPVGQAGRVVPVKFPLHHVVCDVFPDLVE
jgi:hypothetical protein